MSGGSKGRIKLKIIANNGDMRIFKFTLYFTLVFYNKFTCINLFCWDRGPIQTEQMITDSGLKHKVWQTIQSDQTMSGWPILRLGTIKQKVIAKAAKNTTGNTDFIFYKIFYLKFSCTNLFSKTPELSKHKQIDTWHLAYTYSLTNNTQRLLLNQADQIGIIQDQVESLSQQQNW